MPTPIIVLYYTVGAIFALLNLSQSCVRWHGLRWWWYLVELAVTFLFVTMWPLVAPLAWLGFLALGMAREGKIYSHGYWGLSVIRFSSTMFVLGLELDQSPGSFHIRLCFPFVMANINLMRPVNPTGVIDAEFDPPDAD